MAAATYAITSSSTVYIGSQFNKLVRASGDLYSAYDDQVNGPDYIEKNRGGQLKCFSNVFNIPIPDLNDKITMLLSQDVDGGLNRYIYYTKYTIATSTLASKTTLVSGISSFQGLRLDSNGYIYCFYNDGDTLKCRKYTTSWADMTTLTVSGGYGSILC